MSDDSCRVCGSNRIAFREADQKFRCRKCGFSWPSTATLSKRKKRVLSNLTKERIGNSMNKAWKRRKKDPEKDQKYRDIMSKAMKGRAQGENSVVIN